MRRNTAAILAVAAAAATAAACADRSPLAPSGSVPGTITTEGATMALRTVTRSTPLPSDVRATATIGAAGGTIKLTSVGLAVTVPRGALASSTTITVTVPAGATVAYLFQPHGLVFAQPVKIEQDLRYLSIGAIPKGGTPTAGYFADDARALTAAPGSTITVEEVLPASVDTKGTKVGFSVRHFSGYMVSSGGLVPPVDPVLGDIRGR